MTDVNWFNKLFTANTDGITVDLVAKETNMYGSQSQPGKGLPEGYMLSPVLLPN